MNKGGRVWSPMKAQAWLLTAGDCAREYNTLFALMVLMVPVRTISDAKAGKRMTVVCRKPGLRTTRHPSQEKDRGEGKGKATYLTLTS